MGLGGRCWRFLLEGVRPGAPEVCASARGRKEQGSGEVGEELVTAGDRDRTDRSSLGPGQHKGFFFPPSPLTYAALPWLLPIICHVLG